MKHKHSEKGFSLIEGLVIFVVFWIFIIFVVGYALLYRGVWQGYVEPSVYRTDYIHEMKSIADISGEESRKGRNDLICDATETIWILTEMNLMKDTPIEDVSSRKIKEFVLSHREKN